MSSPEIVSTARWLRILLWVVLVASCAARLSHLDEPFWTIDEWGSPQFSIYARNALRYGLVATRLLPVFSFVGSTPIHYLNHGVGGALVLSLWGAFFGISEVSIRVCSFVVSLATTGVIFLLGRELWSPRTGLLAATIYSVLPLSYYLAHIYQMESPFQLFSLLAVWCAIRWSRGGGRRFWWGAALGLGLAIQCDIYSVLLSPALLLLAVLDRERRWGYVLLAALDPLWLLFYLALLKGLGGADPVHRGASKYLTPWAFWTVDNARMILPRLVRLSAFLPPLLALEGLRRSRPQTRWAILLLSLPLGDLLLTTRALCNHEYRVLFFLPVVALFSARLLAEWKDGLVAAAVVATLAVGWPIRAELYRPTNGNDVKIAAIVRSQTRDTDLLVGLPPHMAFYIDRPAMVPYFYHEAVPGTYPTQESFFQALQIWANYPQYDRIILFTQFITKEQYPMDYSQVFEGHPELKRLTPPGADPQVWRRVKPP